MENKKLIRLLIVLIVLITNVGCDRISKIAVRDEIAYQERINVIGEYFIMTNVENRGAFLSTGNSWPEPIRLAVLMILPIFVIGYAIYYIFWNKDLTKWRIIGVAMMVSGGIGNIYDRIVSGSVTDFLYMDFVIFHTGVFNIADVSIMAGMFITIIDTIQEKKRLKKLADT